MPSDKLKPKPKKRARRSSAAPATDQASKPNKAEVWSTARDEQHRIKREAILRVASRLLNLKGYAGMSLTDIANELGLRNAALYYYYESKADLVFACFKRGQNIVSEAIQFAEQNSTNGLDAIECYVRVMGQRLREEGEIPTLQGLFAVEEKHLHAIMKAALIQVERIANLIRRGIEDKSIRECDVLLTTAMLSSALRALPPRYSATDESEWPRLNEEVRTAIRRFLAA